MSCLPNIATISCTMLYCLPIISDVFALPSTDAKKRSLFALPSTEAKKGNTVVSHSQFDSPNFAQI